MARRSPRAYLLSERLVPRGRLWPRPGRGLQQISAKSPFSARSKSHSRSSASPCCLLLVAALRTRLEPLFPALRGRKSTPPAAAAPGEQSQHTQWRTSSCRTAACTGAWGKRRYAVRRSTAQSRRWLTTAPGGPPATDSRLPAAGQDACAVDSSRQRTRICCLLYTSPSPRDVEESRMPSSA